MHNETTTPQVPWYRHRWPWLLASGPVTVIIAGAITTWLAATGNTALVADDYYKQGLTINRTLERERLADDLGVRTEITAQKLDGTGTRLEIVLSMTDAGALPSRLRVAMSHPTLIELDRELLLAGKNGRYGGVLQDLAATHWKLVIEDEARAWRRQSTLAMDAPDAAGKNGG